MRRLVIATTHPIQYQAPWFRSLSETLDEWSVHVFFLTIPDAKAQAEGFGGEFSWDGPLLEGYSYSVATSLRGSGSLADFLGLRLSRARAELRALNPHVLLVLGWQCLGLVQLLIRASRQRIPILLRGESSGLVQRRGWRKRLLRHLCNRAAKFLYIGESNRRFYRQIDLCRKPALLCPYFVDNDWFEAQAVRLTEDRGKLRARWAIPADAFCFVFVGKFVAKKRLMDILDALRMLITTTELSVHLLVVGRGEQEREARAFVNAYALPVTFSGFLNQSEITGAYVTSDCLVMASDYAETWGLAVNEAMACGKPAIVSDRAGCHLDLIRPGETGHVVRFGDVADISQKLIEVAANPALARAMGGNARRLITRDYTVQRAVQAVADALAELA